MTERWNCSCVGLRTLSMPRHGLGAVLVSNARGTSARPCIARRASSACHGDAVAERIELTLRPKADAKPLDRETAERIGRVAHAQEVELAAGGAVFGFSRPPAEGAIVRGNVELAARFELGAHWHTRYELVGH